MVSRLLLSNGRHGGRPSAAASSSRQQQNPHARDEEEEDEEGDEMVDDGLPVYEPPAFPPNAEALRALRELSTNHDTRKYSKHLDDALRMMSSGVVLMNDRLADRKRRLQVVQRKRMQNESEVDKTEEEEALEKVVNELQRAVPKLSSRLEVGVREIIDRKVVLADGKESLEEVTEKSKLVSSMAPPRRAVAGRGRRRGADADRELNQDGGEDGEDEDDEKEQEGPLGPVFLLQTEKQKRADEYSSRTMHQKYGLNNDYIHFKKLWHDAVHGDDKKPLPDPSRWFDGDGGARTVREEEEEDELMIAEEVIDIKCPLSRQVMKEPYVSPECGHTYDKTSVHAYLQDKPGKTAPCPITGCDKTITKANLELNDVMVRQIKRAQSKQSNADEDEA